MRIKWDYNYTVSIGDITKTYTEDQIKTINGQWIIDHKILMDEFGLTETQALHQAGDAFDCLDHAAMAWGFMNNKKSIDVNTGYDSEIYLQDGKYKYTELIGGDIDSVGEGTIPSGTTLVGGIHAHAAYDPKYDRENFSGLNGDKVF